MRRRALAAAAAVAAVCGLPATAQAGDGFTLGVAAGEVTPTSAIVWAHASAPGRGVVEVATDRRFRRVVIRRSVRAARTNDNTVQSSLSGLASGTRYYYRFLIGGDTSDVGQFRTAPAPNSTETIEFAWSGDADAQPQPGETRPFWNNFEVYGRMAREGNHFNVNLGDTIYSDTEVGAELEGGVFQPSAPTALSVADKWAKYRQNIALRNLQRLRAGAGLYSHWDDHEFVNDFSVAENGTALYRDGVRAFMDYSPVSYSRRDGLYRTFRWGRNVELFFLDQRSFRDAKASQGGTCNNPRTGSPDLAPTAPQSNRNTFAALVPALAEPVSQACLDRIRDPNRTFLGSRQLARFKRDVERSTATFKVVVNETPIQQFYALPYDRWEGYEAERQEVLRFLRAEVENVVFLTTDTHANLVNDARFQTLEEGGPRDSGMFDFVTGPVGTKVSDEEIDDVAGQDGSGAALRAAFFKPPPPNGVGMRCAIGDKYSYAQVRVTRSRLTITAKDDRGRPLVDSDGTRCALVLNAR